MVQYQLGRRRQRSHEGADGMWVRVYLDQEGHIVSTDERFHYTLDYRYRYAVQGQVTGIPAFPLRFKGTGYMEGDDTLVSERGVSEIAYEASYVADIFGTAEGCPRGSLVTTVAPYTVNGVFDGSSTADWTLMLGIGTVSSGTVAVGCAPAASLRSGAEDRRGRVRRG